MSNQTRGCAVDHLIAALAEHQHGVVGRRLVVELNGRALHDIAAAFERDRARDRRLNAHGWRVIRITWRQLHDEPSSVATDLERMLAAV